MSEHGIVTEAGTVQFRRLLDAPVDKVWKYLVDSELRAKWFAGGAMDLRPGGSVTLVFRNSDLAPAGEEVPEKFRQYEGMETKGEIVTIEPPRLLVFLWFEDDGPSNEVRWELEPQGDRTRMILTHSRLPNRAMMIDVSGGWHLHLNVLEAVLAGRERPAFWSRQAALQQDYEGRIGQEQE